MLTCVPDARGSMMLESNTPRRLITYDEDISPTGIVGACMHGAGWRTFTNPS